MPDTMTHRERLDQEGDMTLDEALARIAALEREVARLTAEHDELV